MRRLLPIAIAIALGAGLMRVRRPPAPSAPRDSGSFSLLFSDPTLRVTVTAAVAALLGRDHLSPTDFVEIAEGWRPWRTWACVAIRAAAGSVRPARRLG